MPTRAEVEAAAFWDQEICLECGYIQNTPDGGPDDPLVCGECGSPNRLPAQSALAVLAIIEEDEE